MLKPIATFFEAKIHSRITAILISYVVAAFPLITIILFFYHQVRILFSGLPSLSDTLATTLSVVIDWISLHFQINAANSKEWLNKFLIDNLDIPMSFTRGIFESGVSLVANIILISLITYFFLLYRSAFKNFLMAQINPSKRQNLEQLLLSVQNLTKRYMLGQGLVILILGFLIGTGLWIIGVPYPYFWGYLAGFLEIIPYVGTTIGVVLPFTYTLLLEETAWQPWAVVGLYIFVQQLEGNIISPNVMGSSIKINPLFIIIGLFIGAFMWGIPGMILALPSLALMKEIFRSFDALAPISYLMEDGLSKNSKIFLKLFDHLENRFFRLFYRKNYSQHHKHQ